MAACMLARNQQLAMNRSLHNGSRMTAIPSASFMTKAGSSSQHMKMSLLQRSLNGSKFGNYKQMGLTQVTSRNFSSLPDHIKLEMPNLSPTMEKGNIGSWSVAVGDKIGPGDVLCSIETDKATIDYEMQDEGYVAKLLYEAGTKDIPLGKVLAILVDDADDISAFADFSDDSASAAPATPAASAPEPTPAASAAPTPTTPSAKAAPKSSGDRIFISPLAQNMANAQGVDISKVVGTGPGGRIIKADIEEAIASGSAKAGAQAIGKAPELVSAPGEYIDLPNSQIRKVIADRLTYSKQSIPHYYVTVQVQVDNLMKMRAKFNKVSSVKLSVNDFVMKAASMAAVKVPATNSSWMDDFIRQFRNVNMSFAVQTEHGLMAPVVQNVNLKGLEEISAEVKDIAGRARENKLKPEELSGGTFTVSNLGMFGVNNFSAIINPPQACILAVSGAFKQVVVNENAESADDKFAVAHMMNVTLSSDHRVVDGAVAAEWGIHFKRFIENPELMLL